jgi:hypothetical protein
MIQLLLLVVGSTLFIFSKERFDLYRISSGLSMMEKERTRRHKKEIRALQISL